MNLALWVIAGLLAAVFLAGGLIKATQPQRKLAAAPGGGWAGDVSGSTVKAIGALEVLGAAGLVLPAVTGTAPILVPLAAACLALMMVAAAVVHLRRHEARVIAVNIVYFALAVLVAWGRFGPYAFGG
ncbi:DoxX-like family protein [Actinacidiphila yanglinensis]|uniref:DoxX-like family protein n=1 Tax=Actinacidiphila yanglinensis TaxID=310779 RepID=A0A1H6E1T8_9ACTN|nr:DoxX family protein [Actinacidiphila yanglinensis]SEG91143.1 DoxX-like family protein [Actinacidiphila yanglinensis]